MEPKKKLLIEIDDVIVSYPPSFVNEAFKRLREYCKSLTPKVDMYKIIEISSSDIYLHENFKNDMEKTEN